VTIPDYPDDPILRMEEREQARADMIEARREELMEDKTEAGYYPWTPANLAEAVGEIPEVGRQAICTLLERGTTVDDAAAGLLLRRAVQAYWTGLAHDRASREVDDQLRKDREYADWARFEWRNAK